MPIFPRTNRLASKYDFQSVFANPCKVSQNYLLALFIPNSLPHARLGIIIPKHRLKLANKRNYVRRIIRERFREHKELLKGLDIVVLLRSECTPLSQVSTSKLLRTDVDKLWQKLVNFSKPAC